MQDPDVFILEPLRRLSSLGINWKPFDTGIKQHKQTKFSLQLSVASLKSSQILDKSIR